MHPFGKEHYDSCYDCTNMIQQSFSKLQTFIKEQQQQGTITLNNNHTVIPTTNQIAITIQSNINIQ